MENTLEEYAGNWELIDLDTGEDLFAPVEGHPVTLQLSRDGAISGSTGCNRIVGDFSVGPGGKLYIGPLGQTRMYCGGAVGLLEAALIGAFERVDRIRFEEGVLVLRGPGAALRWCPASSS